jgi:chromosome segregation ATPase
MKISSNEYLKTLAEKHSFCNGIDPNVLAALTELRAEMEKERDTMKAEVADYTSATEKVFVSLHAELEETKAKLAAAEQRGGELQSTIEMMTGQLYAARGMYEVRDDRIAQLEAQLKVAKDALLKMKESHDRYDWSHEVRDIINPALAELSRLEQEGK